MLGFDPDRLCETIEDRFAIPVITTALATLEHLRVRTFKRLALLTQGDAPEAGRIAKAFAKEGIQTASSRSLGIAANFDAALTPTSRLAEETRALALASSPDAILIWSTNLDGHALLGKTGEPNLEILDSATLGFEMALQRLRLQHI